MTILLRFYGLFLLYTCVMYSQVELTKEEFINNHYRLTYIVHDDVLKERSWMNNEQIDQKNISVENEEKDRYHLIIALPSNSNPKTTITAINQRNTSPRIAVGGKLLQTSWYKIAGFLWIDDYYCVDIVVDPYFKLNERTTDIAIKEFVIEFDLGNSGNISSVQNNAAISSIIENKKYGTQWRSSHAQIQIPPSDSWIDYTREYLKVGVTNDGIYRLKKSDLQANGVPVNSLDPKTFKVYLKGKEVPIYVFGEQNNVFDDNDYIEFMGRRNYGDTRYREINPFGTSYYEYLNLYSDTTIYWLTWGGAAIGKRIDTVLTVSGVPTDTTRYFDELLRTENNLYWDFSLNPNGLTQELRKNYPELLENETWYEGNIGVGKRTISFSVSNVISNKIARAYTKISDIASDDNKPNVHIAALSINNFPTAYDSGFMQKYQVKTLKAEFSSSLLINGTNTVNINSYPTASSVNTLGGDWYELEYPRNLRTTTDSLNFTYRSLVSSALTSIAVSGITTPSIALYRFSIIDSSVCKITNYTKRNDTLYFADTIKTGNYYFLRSELKISTPIVFYKKQFRNLRAAGQQADYVAITHPYFLPTASNYVSFVGTTYGVTTKLVDINDIYDEFNYGFSAPEPIRDFLMATHALWNNPKPKHVFLIGKGTYDFYGYKTKYFGVKKTVNFIPSFGNPVSDNWFIIWDSTGALIPQMNIGRVPAKTINEFQSYFLKHQKYVSKGFDDWNKRYIFFSGGNFTDPNQLAQSKGTNDFIINNYVTPPPVGGGTSNFYKTINPVTNFGPYTPEYVTNSIKQGSLFISYIGHSGTQTWDNTITNISQLGNIRDRNPMISDFGCSTAKFAESDILSFSELFVNDPAGQAIAYVGNSSLGFTSTAYTFPQYFYKKILVDTSVSIGESHRLAKIDFIKKYSSSGANGLFIKTNSIIGDPIVKLPIPTKPNYSFSTSQVSLVPERPTDQDEEIMIKINYTNLGKVIGDSVSILIKNLYQGSEQLSKTVKRKVPLFNDTIVIVLPIKAKPGEHTLTVTLDPQNDYNEIYENDNLFVYTFIVASNNVRNLSITPLANQTKGKITLLNPSAKSLSSTFNVEISLNKNFSSSQIIQIPYDTFLTQFAVDTNYIQKRIWMRTKFGETGIEGLTYSYIVGNSDNYLLNDSTSFLQSKLEKVKIQDNAIVFDTSKIIFKAISGGASEGSTSVITKNGQNFIPENTLRGFHVCLFDASTYDPKGYFLFDIQAGAAIGTNFKNFLDTLGGNYIVIIAIANDVASNGTLFTTALKASIKQYGSILIDSVKVADSWAIIGKKNSTGGSVPEQYLKRFNGKSVEIDTTIIIPNTQGTFETETIGPVAKWKNVELRYNQPINSQIKMSVLGVSSNSLVDTLNSVFVTDSLIDLSSVNASQYPSIRLRTEFSSSASGSTLSVSRLAVNYDALPELGANYQTFKGFHLLNNIPTQEIFENDSIIQGEKVLFTYRVYNAGGTTAKNVPVKLSSIWDNNYIETFSTTALDSIVPMGYKELTSQYNTSLGSGKRTIQLTIDPDTTVREIFKDNNFYSFPFVVKKNNGNPLLPNLVITQNAITSNPVQITNEVDTAAFTVIYANSGSIVNDSISILVKHMYQNSVVASWIVRRKYPVSNDTIVVRVPILKNAGEHQLSVELDYNGLIVESSETDNSSNYYFLVATTDFKILHPSPGSVHFVDRVIFLNPTVSSGNNTSVNLELDTLANFSQPQAFTNQLQQFATSFSLPGLKKLKRYYWRVKVFNGGRDWTTGTLYSGDSTVSSFGQIDSVSWNENQFVRTAYSVDSGARVVDTKISINASSAGFNDGNIGSILINEVNVVTSILGSGHNIIVLDTTSFSVLSQRRFDITINPDESDSLAQFISAINNGKIVIDVIVGDGANNLTVAARNALKTIGSAQIDNVNFRDSWAIIGRKGAAAGSVPEMYKPQNSGSALAETTIVRIEKSGRISTPVFGPFSTLSNLILDGSIPSGSKLKVQFVGISKTNSSDTLVNLDYQNNISLSSVNTHQYRNGKLVFHFSTPSSFSTIRANASINSPMLKSWKISSIASTELAVSNQSSIINRNPVMEGESIEFSGKVFNVSTVSADSVTVQLKTTTSGIDNILKRQRFVQIPANDSVTFSFSYDTRGRRGNHAFTFEIDPSDSVTEQTKINNSVTIPYVVQADTLRPTLQITFDGIQVVNGDYVGQHPEIQIRFTDNNPSSLLASDTSNFKMRLNNAAVPFIAGTAELTNTNTSGRADVRWTPVLADGENIIQVSAKDISENYSDTVLIFVNVASQLRIMDIFNLPNPFNNSTLFTFNIAGPSNPDEVIIKIYTVAGRLIQELNPIGKIGFNKISWNGRDKDGDQIGIGVYLYKVIVKMDGKQVEGLSKLVKMR